MSSAFARQRFGAKNYPLNLSLVNFAIVFGSILNLAIQGALGGDARVGAFTVLLVLSVIATLSVSPFSRMLNASQKMLEDRRAQHQGFLTAVEAEMQNGAQHDRQVD